MTIYITFKVFKNINFILKDLKNYPEYFYCTFFQKIANFFGTNNIISQDYSWPTLKFHDFPGLENEIKLPVL